MAPLDTGANADAEYEHDTRKRAERAHLDMFIVVDINERFVIKSIVQQKNGRFSWNNYIAIRVSLIPLFIITDEVPFFARVKCVHD